MKTSFTLFFAFAAGVALLAMATPVLAQTPAGAPAAGASGRGGRGARGPVDPNPPKHEDTEVYEPVPPVVTPGATDSQPPSDAIVLFDGKNLDQWVMNKDKSPAVWTVADGILTVKKGRDSGNIETKRTFKNYQLHIEFRIPENIQGTDPGARE